MNDTLEYISKDPVHRRYDHWHLTFSLIYAFTENFILPFSHDEVVHGKGSMFEKMPGDDWQQAATLRTLYGFMYAHPGKKLMFMGAEFAQGREWNYDTQPRLAPARVPDARRHPAASCRDLNRTYAAEPALHEVDFDYTGFQWIDCNDSENSVVSFIRRARDRTTSWSSRCMNFTPGAARRLPHRRARARRLHRSCSTATRDVYGGSNLGNGGMVFTEPIASHGHAAVAASEPAAARVPAVEAGEVTAQRSAVVRRPRAHGGSFGVAKRPVSAG